LRGKLQTFNFSQSKFLLKLAQMILDKMNLYPTLWSRSVIWACHLISFHQLYFVFSVIPKIRLGICVRIFVIDPPLDELKLIEGMLIIVNFSSDTIIKEFWFLLNYFPTFSSSTKVFLWRKKLFWSFSRKF
jgi:hypothetical protein